jgi:hypothetical protein
MEADKLQKQRIAILTKGNKALKKRLVQDAIGDMSKGSTNDLTHDQAAGIIRKLERNENWAYFDAKKRSHRQILSLCIQFGWSKPHNVHLEVADIDRLSDWLKSEKSPVRKKLKDMTTQEVSKIIYALERMVYKSY